MTGDTLDRIEAWARDTLSVASIAHARDVLALVEVARAARDESLADALAVIEHALGPNGSPTDALRHIQKTIVQHRLPIRAALARLDKEPDGA